MRRDLVNERREPGLLGVAFPGGRTKATPFKKGLEFYAMDTMNDVSGLPQKSAEELHAAEVESLKRVIQEKDSLILHLVSSIDSNLFVNSAASLITMIQKRPTWTPR